MTEEWLVRVRRVDTRPRLRRAERLRTTQRSPLNDSTLGGPPQNENGRDKRPVEEADVQIVDPPAPTAPVATPFAPVAATSPPAGTIPSKPTKRAQLSEPVLIEGGSSSVVLLTGRASLASAPTTEPTLREWGRRSDPASVASRMSSVKTSDLIDDVFRGLQLSLGSFASLVHRTDHTLEATEGRLRAVEEKMATLKSRNAELEDSVAAEVVRADQSNELAAKLTKGVDKLKASLKEEQGAREAEKTAREADERAHEQTKAEFSGLVAEERRKAVMEYKKSDVHIDQITGYFFNPRIQYKDNVHNDGEVMRGTMNVITRLARTMNERLYVMAEVERYKMKVGIYGGYDMTYAAQRLTPAEWWIQVNYQQAGTNPLAYVAIRVLSQITSSSLCERNWSTFSLIHTKIRNRLGVDRLEK
ncbi:hypothetical protein Taro_038334, partial [Colocasia esculenta]|nr:hypothetical protein [Colocasia esculenta]